MFDPKTQLLFQSLRNLVTIMCKGESNCQSCTIHPATTPTNARRSLHEEQHAPINDKGHMMPRSSNSLAEATVKYQLGQDRICRISPRSSAISTGDPDDNCARDDNTDGIVRKRTTAPTSRTQARRGSGHKPARRSSWQGGDILTIPKAVASRAFVCNIDEAGILCKLLTHTSTKAVNQGAKDHHSDGGNRLADKQQSRRRHVYWVGVGTSTPLPRLEPLQHCEERTGVRLLGVRCSENASITALPSVHADTHCGRLVAVVMSWSQAAELKNHKYNRSVKDVDNSRTSAVLLLLRLVKCWNT